MLYLIGLGLNEKSISLEGIEAIKKCKKIYLESYTVNFPYSKEELEKVVGSKIISANRDFVENFKMLDEAKKQNIALLVYGSPLTATTHISLIQEAKKQKIKCEIINNASVLDAMAESGLQLYKFGKITNLPKWNEEENYIPTSFIETIKENQKINAHSLILVDIGLEFKDAIERLENLMKKEKINFNKIVVCERLGNKDKKIIYGEIENLKKINVKPPYCLIIPARLHFMEEEVLKSYN